MNVGFPGSMSDGLDRLPPKPRHTQTDPYTSNKVDRSMSQLSDALTGLRWTWNKLPATITHSMVPNVQHMSQARLLCSNEINEGTIRSIKDKEAIMGDLIPPVTFNSETNTYTSSNSNGCEKVKTIMIPLYPYPDPRQGKDIPNVCRTRFRI